MINSENLLKALQQQVRNLEDNLRARCDSEAAVDAPLKARYEAAKAKKRTAATYKAWREEELTQAAVAWVLACVFVRFLEDNELVEVPKLSGPGARLQRARDEHELFFRQHPTETEREFLLGVFDETGRLPGMKELFDRRHNPLWTVAPSGDACRELWQFWQKTDAVTGALAHDFSDPDWNTRFLGDLYQDLSEAARKRYALLQTPEFVEEFILDRTLTPALETFGWRVARMIDPTCGSGHFLLGGFARLFRIWQAECPGENPRALAQRALDGVFGVDLNPFAVAIARFRLLLAALKGCGPEAGGRKLRLKDAPDFQINLAVGDSLLHGARFDPQGRPYLTERQSLFGGEEAFKDELAHYFETEDSVALHRILGQQYHAVVGNPPYITVKDRAVSELYRARYLSCHRKYSLSVPFMERFFDLAVKGDNTSQHPAGFVGQITANSFMKREFGKKLIEEYLPRWDLTHVLDTDKAHIPGHATGTAILLGRNREPISTTVRLVMGIRKEEPAPQDPTTGQVWLALLNQVDISPSESEWLSVADIERQRLKHHPWSIGGGGAADLKEVIDEAAGKALVDYAEMRRSKPVIGPAAILGEDDAFIRPVGNTSLSRLAPEFRRPLIDGDLVRDWGMVWDMEVIFPYDGRIELVLTPEIQKCLWSTRTVLANRADFGKQTYAQCGRPYWEYHQIPQDRNRADKLLVFSDLATHNSFVLKAGPKLFNRHAPLIKLKAGATENEHCRILGLLNSSTTGFWLRQVCSDKGAGGIGGGISAEMWEHRFEFDGTKVARIPIPTIQTTQLPTVLVQTSTALQGQSPASTLATWSGPGSDLLRTRLITARAEATRLRGQMIAWQEDLDWQVYEAFSLVEAVDAVSLPEGQAVDAIPPEGIELGQRAFEIVLARRMAAGEAQTTWFERHGSTPVPEIPRHWPAEYRELVERRIRRIDADANIRLIEQPEYKRRWNTEPWDEQFQRAARDWLLARLEGYVFEGQRVCDLKASFEPAAHGFTAATRSHLVSANQLADVAQTDRWFMEVAENYVGSSGFSVPKLVRELVESESVPYLPFQRYKESGLRKRQDWEHVWELQRQEDRIDAEEQTDEPGITDIERLRRQTSANKRKKEELGDIPVPPKYASADFLKSTYWKLRGKLDVPKERWVSYPGAERAGDDSLVIAWAGWDHLQQAQALAEYFLDARDNQGWQSDRLKPLLAGLADLIPWLKQWHNTPDPNLGMGLGDYFAGFLEEECRRLQITVQACEAIRFAYQTATVSRGRKAGGRQSASSEEVEVPNDSTSETHWMDREFTLLAPKRRALSDYRVLVWPELLRQMPGAVEFDTFRRAYWLLSEPTKLEKLGCEHLPNIPASWWKSRSEEVAKVEFLDTLKGSVVLGDIRIWKSDGVRLIQWTGANTTNPFPEAVDDARLALQLAGTWEDDTPVQTALEIEREVALLETR